MIVNENGIILSTLQENLAYWQERLKSTFGNDFVIKKEGVIDNIATSSSLSIMDLENQIAFIVKQLNPYTAEGEWQDRLYSLIGLWRRQATYTVVQRNVSGTANTTIDVGELLIENEATKDQFRNNDQIQIDANGVGVGSFTAEESGSIELPSDATIKIVTPLENVSGVYYDASNVQSIGQDYETDAEFRERWKVSSSTANANTGDGLYRALLELVDTKSDVKIINNRKNTTVGGIPAHCMKIVLNSAYDDETIAQTIMDNIVDGNQVGLQGSISVDVTDSEGQTETIKFDRATALPLYIKAQVVLKSGYLISTVQSAVRESVLSYISSHKFEMGSKIWANIFAGSIYSVDGVSEITSLQLSDDETNWDDYYELDQTEVATFSSGRISVSEET